MYRLTPEQQQIASNVAALADQHVAPYAAEVDKSAGFPRQAITALGGRGLLGLTVPAAYGGQNQGLRTAAAVLDELARPMTLDRVTVGADRALTAPGKGLEMMLGVVLPLFQVTELGLRTCGAVALGKTLPLERLFRDARAPVVMAPTTDQAHDFIGRALCGLELFQ